MNAWYETPKHILERETKQWGDILTLFVSENRNERSATVGTQLYKQPGKRPLSIRQNRRFESFSVKTPLLIFVKPNHRINNNPDEKSTV